MDVTIANKLYVIVVYVCDDIKITIPYSPSCPCPLKLHVTRSMVFQSMVCLISSMDHPCIECLKYNKPYQFDQVFYLSFRMLYCLWFLEQEVWTSPK